MSYIFRDGIIDWETDISTTSVKKSTDWVYSSKAKCVGGLPKTIKRTVEKGVGVQPSNGNYIEDVYSIPNGFINNELVFNINKYADTDITDNNSKIKCDQGVWNYPETALNGWTQYNTFILNENTDSVNREIESPWLVVGGFNCNVPETASVTAIQVRIERSSFSFNDSIFKPLYPNIFITDYLPSPDSKMLDENITTYTRDSIITLHEKYDDESAIDINFFDNKAEYFKAEIIDVSTSSFTFDNTNNKLTMNNLSVKLNDFDNPIGAWSNTKETVLYGDSCYDTWGTDDDTMTSLLNNDFAVKIKIKQKIFKGYGYKTFYNFDLLKQHSNIQIKDQNTKKLNWGLWQSKGVFGDWLSVIKSEYPYKIINTNNSTESHYYHRNSISMFDISIPLASYVLSRIYSVSVKVFYEERPEGFKTIMNSREFIDNNNLLLKTNDIYFKNQKCFDGVCYKYINNLNDIYNKSLITSDGYCINNMYNEYSIIDKYSKNVYYSDICYSENIDITETHRIIDVNLVSGMKVFLYGQSDTKENGIYVVNSNYKLDYFPIFPNRNKSEKAKIYIDYGSGKGKQFFLNTDSNKQFPIDNENKEFIEGKSYILKNLIKYDIYNTSVKYPNKILFTDYSVPRDIVPDSENLFDYIDINSTNAVNTLTIRYKDSYINYRSLYNYKIISEISGSDNGATDNTCDTFFVQSDFYNKSLIGDYVVIDFYTDETKTDDKQILTLNTKIKDKLSNYKIQFSDTISRYHLDYISGITGWCYRITNINCLRVISTKYDFVTNFIFTPFSDVISVSDIAVSTIRVSPKKNKFKYLNYNDFEISYNGTNYKFNTSNQMVSYKLKPFIDGLLANIGSTITIEKVYNDEILNYNEFIFIYTEINNNGNWIITPSSSYKYKLASFRENTYVNVSDNIIFSKSRVLSVSDTQIIIERPKNNGTSVINDNFYISNISTLSVISDILYDVYMNYTHSYYNKIDDSVKSLVCSTYIDILKDNSIIRSIVSGMIYQDNNEWNFDVYNLKFDSKFKNTFDPNLTYYPMEIIELGIDNKTKLQKQLDISNFSYETDVFSIIKSISVKRGIIPNYSFISSSTNNGDTNVYLGSWSSGLRGTGFYNIFNFRSKFISNENKKINIIREVGDVLYDMRFIDVTSGDRFIYGKNISFNEGKYYITGNISDTNNYNDYNFTLTSHLATGSDTTDILCTASSSLSYRPNECFFIYTVDSGLTSNTIEILSNFTDISVILTDSSNINNNLSLCGYYNNKTSSSIGHIFNNYLNTDYLNKNIGFNFIFDDNRTLIYGIDIFGAVFHKSTTIKENTFVIGIYDNTGITKRIYRDHSGYKTTLQAITNLSISNSLFICKFSKDEYYSKIHFEIPIHYKNVTKISNILTDGEFLYFSFINVNPLLSRKENVVMKMDYNGNIIFDIFYINNSTNDNDITICQDDDNIYLSNIYDSKLSINNFKFDTPNGETYSYLLVIDKKDGGIKSGINLVSSETISITSIMDETEFLKIAGNFKGSILINNIPLNSVSQEYYITKLKKADLIW